MSKQKNKKNKKGMSPGSLVFTGDRKVDDVIITLLDFDENNFSETAYSENDIDKLLEYNLSKTVSWINISGLHNTELVSKIGKIFNIHALVLEDILHVGHNPKVDDYDSYLFIIAKMINYNNTKNELEIEQVSFILGENYLITFQEKEGDVFDIIRDKIRNNSGRIRKSGADYLAYRLMDTIVDNYFIVLEKIDERIEDIEDSLLNNDEKSNLNNIHSIRKEIIKLKRAVTPLRDIIHSFEKEQSSVFAKSTYLFLRDLYDHVKQVIDNTENYREVVNGLQELHISKSGYKMNEIVKVLTIISTIFIPLTFIAGIYGMNFKTENSIWNMPELGWQFGYPFVIGVMAVVVVIMISFFKKKKWL